MYYCPLNKTLGSSWLLTTFTSLFDGKVLIIQMLFNLLKHNI